MSQGTFDKGNYGLGELYLEGEIWPGELWHPTPNAACEMTEEVSEVLKSLTEFPKIVQNVAKIPILPRLETQNLVFGPWKTAQIC